MTEPLTRAIANQIQKAPVEQKARILEQQSLWPELLTAKQITELPPDPTRWIWDRCLPVGGCSLLVAKPKVGKSTFAVCLSLAVSRGMSFFGRPTQQCPVAYLSLDASIEEIAEVFLHFGLRADDQIMLHAGSAPHDAIGWLVHRIQQNGIKFCVIDTLQMMFRFRNINDYSEVTNVVEPLLDAARANGCHIMLTHHAKKESLDDLDSGIGSNALRGRFYQFLHLKKLPESETRIFRTEGRGGKNFPEMVVGFDKTGLMDLQGTREDQEINDIMVLITDFLQVEGEATEREIRSGIEARGMYISKALRKLFKQNAIERVGKGAKGNPFKYSIPASLCSYISEENENNREQNSTTLDSINKSRGYAKSQQFWEQNGNRMEQNRFSAGVGNSIFGNPTPVVDKVLAEIEAERKRK